MIHRFKPQKTEISFRVKLLVVRFIVLIIIVLVRFMFTLVLDYLFMIFFGIILFMMFFFERTIREININLDKQTIEISSKSLFTLLESNVLYIDELKLQTFYSNWRNYLYLSKVIIDIKSENFNDVISCWDNFSSDQLKEMDLILNNKATR